MSTKNIIFHPFSALVITIIAGLFVWSMHKNLQEVELAQTSLEKMQAELTDKQAATQSLQQELDNAQTPLKQEQRLRNELLLQREGEVVLMVAAPSPTPSPSAGTNAKSNWQLWWEWMWN